MFDYDGISSAITFRGETDGLPECADRGDCVVYQGDCYVYIDNEWVLMSSASEDEKEIPTNCPNCGAPLHGRVCEYCGTEF